MQKISLVNIILAIIYVLVYLKSGTFNSTAGIFMIIIFNWLALKSFYQDDYRWRIWHYLIGAWTVYFIGTLMYGVIHILSSSITYTFMSTDTVIYLTVNFIFCALVMIQMIRYSYRNYITLKLKSK